MNILHTVCPRKRRSNFVNIHISRIPLYRIKHQNLEHLSSFSSKGFFGKQESNGSNGFFFFFPLWWGMNKLQLLVVSCHKSTKQFIFRCGYSYFSIMFGLLPTELVSLNSWHVYSILVNKMKVTWFARKSKFMHLDNLSCLK